MTVLVLKLIESNRKNKRFCAILNNGKKIHFGDKNGSTYIDHGNKKLRENYIKRHLGNKTEYYNLLHLILSPSLCSLVILWGPYRDINKNVNYLNKLLLSH